jgi:hypothetical protein
MENKNIEKLEATELEALKNDIEFTELEDRLEMVQAAAADEKRCNGSC